ncbi:HD domain-containing protein [Candidatus Nitrosotenuis cloacae]|uniref:HD domain-containing protein n=1 Tax=Candidatus Nitrosotenuis cloacae TaxID=1603555 RepID=UPI0022831170|nr:HD domain-containing protein [Candidatus Nitrosotenuis cloacae]
MKATQENTSLDEFFTTVLKLKAVERQGWKDKLGMRHPESVADHCFSMAAIAMVLADQDHLDTQKVLKMSLLHDLAETITGDLTPNDVTKSKKEKMENAAMKKILQCLDKKLEMQYWKIWQEYQKNTTKESCLVHQVDKLEMALQAKVYQKSGYKKTAIEPFFKSARSAVVDPKLAKYVPDL